MDTYCGVDPGFSGGIAILKGKKTPLIFKMPVIETVKIVKKKGKKDKKAIKKIYDILAIRKIFEKYLDKDSIIILEKVSVMPGQGGVSNFNFGRGIGNLEGIIGGLLNCLPISITPQKWKKNFPQLTTDEMIKKRAEIKELRLIGKTLEDKEDEKANKKQIDKINGQVKAEAKDAARHLVSSLYPDLAKDLVCKNTDGMAESVLMAIYGKDNKNELV